MAKVELTSFPQAGNVVDVTGFRAGSNQAYGYRMGRQACHPQTVLTNNSGNPSQTSSIVRQNQ
jgi:hypothetical protein